MSKMENVKMALDEKQLFLALPYPTTDGNPRMIDVSKESALGLIGDGTHIAQDLGGDVVVVYPIIAPEALTMNAILRANS